MIDKNDNNNYKINDNIYLLENNFRNRKDYKEILYYNDSIINNTNNVSFNKNKNGIKLHSSLFFQNCKKIISKNEYRKLLEIVKLSNLKALSKEDTYLEIIALLGGLFPELSDEFKLLFV